MRVGLYFGSFNPVHTGHLIIATYIVEHIDINQVWFVVSPQNPLKKSSSLLNEYSRLNLVRIAIRDETRLRASSVEFNLPKPSYTINTLAYLQEKYPQHEFSIVIGSDSFQNLNKWKNYEVIIKNYLLYVYVRPGFEIKNSYGAKTILLNNVPLLGISSTYIRKQIKEKKSIRFLVPDTVKNEIENNGYYR